jgi:glycosyltransferase involved in cell wall biosynthesis
MSVSVIIPCYKMGRYVGEALESVGSQTYRSWEVIVVDDCGPEDGTRQTVETFKKQFPSNRIEYIRHPVNRGVSAARNTAIQSAKGEFFAFLDPDDCWLPEHLETQMAAFSSRPLLEVSTSPAKIFKGDTEQSDEVWGYERWQLDCFPYSLALICAITMSASVVTRRIMDKVGLFDETAEMQHIEDYDLWVRIAKAGGEFNFSKTATCCYRRHAGGATADIEKSNRRMFVLVQKHREFWQAAQAVALVQQGLHLRQVESDIRGLHTILDNKHILKIPARIARRVRALLNRPMS